MNMVDPGLMILIAMAFCTAGFVKGMVGFGLPTVSLALLSLFVNLPTAMALLVMPSLLTNIWQAIVGGQFTILLRRLWPFLLMAVTMVHLGAELFTMVETSLLQRGLGALLLLYALFALVGKAPQLSPCQERISSPIFGAINGLLTGLTGTLFVPGVVFLQAIGLSRDALIQAMGMLFAASTASLGLALYWHDLMPFDVGILSCAALLPALFGMGLGQALRGHLSQDIFRRLFLIAIGGLGSHILLS
jgi:uncharacterized membrane protein YfcA